LDEFDREPALDVMAEIGGNHFVASRALMLRMAERSARNGRIYNAKTIEPGSHRQARIRG
jgi:hypothetical protein